MFYTGNLQWRSHRVGLVEPTNLGLKFNTILLIFLLLPKFLQSVTFVSQQVVHFFVKVELDQRYSTRGPPMVFL